MFWKENCPLIDLENAHQAADKLKCNKAKNLYLKLHLLPAEINNKKMNSLYYKVRALMIIKKLKHALKKQDIEKINLYARIFKEVIKKTKLKKNTRIFEEVSFYKNLLKNRR